MVTHSSRLHNCDSANLDNSSNACQPSKELRINRNAPGKGSNILFSIVIALKAALFIISLPPSLQ